jgi:hypothetical protein
MTHSFLRANGDMDTTHDDFLARCTQVVCIMVCFSGELGRQGKRKNIAVISDLVRLLVNQGCLDGLWSYGIW